MKVLREIVGFLGGPKGARTNSETPVEHTGKDGVRTYVIAVLKGSVDVETKVIIQQDFAALHFPKDQIELLEVGMSVYVDVED